MQKSLTSGVLNRYTETNLSNKGVAEMLCDAFFDNTGVRLRA